MSTPTSPTKDESADLSSMAENSKDDEIERLMEEEDKVLEEINRNASAADGQASTSPSSKKSRTSPSVKKSTSLSSASPQPKKSLSPEKSASAKTSSKSVKSSKSKKLRPDIKNSKPSSAASITVVDVTPPVNLYGYPKLDENNDLPDGVFAHFMTSKTQEIFQCKVDVDVTTDSPYKLIQKADIMEDFRLRAAVCDFYPFKKEIIDYPEDEILIGYDPEFAFGQNFFIVLTEEAKEAILNPPMPETEDQEETEEEVIHKWVPPVYKDWVSLGSEAEVTDENVYTTRKLISMTVNRLRKDFGAPVELADRQYQKGKDSYNACVPDAPVTEQVRVMQLDLGTQAIPEAIDAGTQTTWKYPRNATTQYYPREFTEEECEHIEKTENVNGFIESVTQRFEVALQQNEIMNIFYNDWLNLGDNNGMIGSKADNHLKEYQSFTDLQFSKAKIVSCIEWHPNIKGLVAVGIVDKNYFSERIANMSKLILTPSLILLWSFTDPIHPQLLLEAPDDIYCFKFSPTNPNIVAGGCINGQIVMWDIMEYADKLKQPRGSNRNKKATTIPGYEDPDAHKIPIARYSAVSSIENGHTCCITDLYWIPSHMEINRVGVTTESKSSDCAQLMTCAVDHQVLIWDTRASKAALEKSRLTKNPMGVPATFRHLDLTWKPLLKVYTQKSEPGGDHSPTKFSIEEQHRGLGPLSSGDPITDLNAVPSVPEAGGDKKRVLDNVKTHFYVGTEDGAIVYVDWMPQRDTDTGKSVTPKPEYYHSLHDGPIVALERSPFFKDILLCVGGWTITIWKDGVSSGPILHSAAAPSRLTHAMWSPSRPAVFYVARHDGGVDIWDLLDRTHEPSLRQSVSSNTLTAISPHAVTNNQHLLAVGDSSGTLHILEIPWSLRQPTPNELSGVSNYFDREVKRRAYVVKRWEMREEEKRNIEVEIQKKAGIAPQVMMSDEELEIKERQEYEEYLKTELAFLRELGLKEEEDPLVEL